MIKYCLTCVPLPIIIIDPCFRSVMIRDTSHVNTDWKSTQPKADPNIPGNVGSPMKGEVIELKVAVGDPVEKGQVVAIISAMKMEMAVQVSRVRCAYFEIPFLIQYSCCR